MKKRIGILFLALMLMGMATAAAQQAYVHQSGIELHHAEAHRRGYAEKGAHQGKRVGDVAYITGNVAIADRAVVRGVVELDGRTFIQGQVLIDIYPNDRVLRICSDAVFQGNAVIHSLNDFIIMHNNWSSGRHFVWTRSNNMWSAGCFYGTGEELIKKAMQDSVASGRGYKRAVDYVESMLEDEGQPVVV